MRPDEEEEEEEGGGGEASEATAAAAEATPTSAAAASCSPALVALLPARFLRSLCVRSLARGAGPSRARTTDLRGLVARSRASRRVKMRSAKWPLDLAAEFFFFPCRGFLSRRVLREGFLFDLVVFKPISRRRQASLSLSLSLIPAFSYLASAPCGAATPCRRTRDRTTPARRAWSSETKTATRMAATTSPGDGQPRTMTTTTMLRLPCSLHPAAAHPPAAEARSIPGRSSRARSRSP